MSDGVGKDEFVLMPRNLSIQSRGVDIVIARPARRGESNLDWWESPADRWIVGVEMTDKMNVSSKKRLLSRGTRDFTHRSNRRGETPRITEGWH